MPRFKTASLVVNPYAHNASQIDVAAAGRQIEQAGVSVSVTVPDSIEGSTAALRDAVHGGAEVVFMGGGDGTLRQAAKELVDTKVVLAPIALGTANVLAKELGIPRDWQEAIEIHLQGQTQEMDVGWAGDEPFLLMASIGWDAEVAANVNLAIKKRVGAAAYVLTAATRVRNVLAPKLVKGTIDHVEAVGEGSMLVIGNTRNYGGVVEFTPHALANDGVFDLCALKPRTLLQGVQLMVGLARRRLSDGDVASHRRASHIFVETPDMLVQVDGDVIGETPMTFTLATRALQISVPAGGLPPIFGGSDKPTS